MKSLLWLSGFILVLMLQACDKDKAPGNQVQIRIVNSTSSVLSDAVLGSEIYGSVLPGQTSVYHDFDKLTYAPKFSFYRDTVLIELLILYCGTPPIPEPSYLEAGKYTYTVINDNSWPQGFSYTFTKE